MKGLRALLILGLLSGVAAPASAQRSKSPKDSARTIPAAARPPKGMCRIWIEGVPAAQQPAPTDCPTAVRNKPENGRVIFGDDYADSTKSKPATKLPPVKGFSDVKPPVVVFPKRPPEQSLE